MSIQKSSQSYDPKKKSNLTQNYLKLQRDLNGDFRQTIECDDLPLAN